MISENLKRNFNITIGALVATSLIVTALIFLFSFSSGELLSTSSVFFLNGFILLVISLLLRSLMRHLLDQINTYFKAQESIVLTGKLTWMTLFLGGIIALVGGVFNLSYGTPAIFFLVVISLAFVGLFALSLWVFTVTRNLRFLNLITNCVKIWGVAFAGTTFLVALILDFLYFTKAIEQLYLLGLAVVFALSIGWFIGLHQSLTR